MRKYWTIAATATHAPYKMKGRGRFASKLSSSVDVLQVKNPSFNGALTRHDLKTQAMKLS